MRFEDILLKLLESDKKVHGRYQMTNLDLIDLIERVVNIQTSDELFDPEDEL